MTTFDELLNRMLVAAEDTYRATDGEEWRSAQERMVDVRLGRRCAER